MSERKSAHYQIAKFLRSKESEQFELTSTDALILRCTADYMDMSPVGECRATLKTIAYECKLSQRRVSPRLQKLCRQKLLLRSKKWKLNRHYLGEYFSLSHDKMSDDNCLIGKNVPQSEDNLSGDQTTDCPLTRDTEKQTKRERSESFSQSLFDQFWEAYPRKIGKKETQKIWIKRNLNSCAETIINDVKVRIAKDRQWQKKEFIPHPSTYLNGDRWTDEINEVKNEKHPRTEQLNPRQSSIQNYLNHVNESVEP